MIFRFSRGPAFRPISSYSSKTVATQVPTMCMLVDQKFPPDLRKMLFVFLLSSPHIVHLVSSFAILLHDEGPSDRARAWVHLVPQVILFPRCNPEEGGAKQRVLPCHAHLVFCFLLNSISFSPIYFFPFVYTHLLKKICLLRADDIWCSCLFFFFRFAMPGLIWSCDNPLVYVWTYIFKTSFCHDERPVPPPPPFKTLKISFIIARDQDEMFHNEK